MVSRVRWPEIMLIAFALAMDAFAVSVASGVAMRHFRVRHALTMACWFGLFQAIMPLLGWLCGTNLAAYISRVDHWVAFGLLAFTGSKMLYEAFKIEEVEEKSDPLDVYVLFTLSIATSIDALATGLVFATLEVAIFAPVLAIGLVTFAMSFAGVWIGVRSGHFFEKKIEIAGGAILIAIGAKILVEHLFFR
jgi:manganese efflux pump family protein